MNFQWKQTPIFVNRLRKNYRSSKIDEIYQTNLPDRYLILRLSHFLKIIKSKLVCVQQGVMFYLSSKFRSCFQSYQLFKSRLFSNLNLKDASGNIYLYKILVFQNFSVIIMIKCQIILKWTKIRIYNSSVLIMVICLDFQN